ncbi:MAG: hypothetical protein COT90_00315 [Candidatus Diapherotrites archaeon CG10_big_fil_rev_8_21_14_0_10_31_34]|nr:MAG: hypothetical protein COT90_00315 [Candidatus Diapherotrites archaeon CG10_big_fil_rev_8_21_14_0_10_31_34]PJA20574.1 MAG: hypothetical protein COX63_00770 [Candidatus Diapherotrites archaeon CG_4_10_14_0_2_um_filter_31_5]
MTPKRVRQNTSNRVKSRKQKKGRTSRILLRKDPLYAALQRTIDGEINLIKIAGKKPEVLEKAKKNSFKRIKQKMALKKKQMKAYSSLDFS